MPKARFSLRLAKEDFKFSAGHFTLFADGSAERLHGHNYRVAVEISGVETDELGLLADVARVKSVIRAACAELDERTLIPEKCERIELSREGPNLTVQLAERSYRFPVEDVALLPLANVSIELLARSLWDRIAPALDGSPADRLQVEVEETAGQSATYVADLP